MNKPIAIVILVIANIMVGYLFVVPKYEESAALSEEVSQKQAEYKAQSDYQLKLSSSLKDIESKQDALSRMQVALPKESSLGSLIYFFQEKARENEITIRSLSKGGSQGAGRVAAVNVSSREIMTTSFTASLAGAYEGLKNFLRALENSARIFEVGTISLVPSGAAQNGNYNFTLEFKTYSY